MRRVAAAITVVLAIASLGAPVRAENASPDVGFTQPTYALAKVTGIIGEKEVSTEGGSTWQQRVRIRFLNGQEKGEELSVDHGGEIQVQGQQKVRKGERVVVVGVDSPDGATYYIADTYRLGRVAWIAGVFMALVVLLGQWKRGAGSILGLAASVGILLLWIIPRIVAGENALWTTVTGSTAIAVVTLYLAHGFRARTSIALAGTLLTLGAAALLSVAFVHFARLYGNGSEDAFFLQAGPAAALDLRGILLAGVLIGVLGVLDDITTGTAAAVDEIHEANKRLSRRELFRRGLSVGREHIASLVNTLALAYVGASFPLFLLLTTNNPQPLWSVVNSERISEEIIRTLVGSTALLLAVPLTTALAAWWFSRRRVARASADTPDASIGERVDKSSTMR